VSPADTDDDGHGDLADGIFSNTEYSAGQPLPREFKAWHLPRKQFVRKEQWVAQALRIFEGRSDPAPVKYLGLPGVDLLDLRYMHERICLPLGRPLRFLGFNSEIGSNSKARVDLNTSIDEVTRLGSIDSQSDVVPDDFRSLARADSMGWKKARRLGPFDVVNLDLCDGIATDSPEMNSSLYEAIAALLSLQVRSPNRWVLLVTSRIGHEHFHNAALRTLLAHLDSNVSTCSEFATECRELFGLEDLEAIDPETCSAEVFLRMMLVALCKWLLVLGQTQSANHVELASCQGYRVDRGSSCEDLVSFALVFTPIVQAPSDALAPSPGPGIDECAEATRIAGRAKRLKDIDGILADDPLLTEELVAETELLLVAARYDKAQFRSWLSERAAP
jgi:hypothetical protein